MTKGTVKRILNLIATNGRVARIGIRFNAKGMEIFVEDKKKKEE